MIINPGSKDGKSKKNIDRIIKLLQENNINFEYKITKKLNDAFEFSKSANKKSYDVIIAVGGDGTINQVINGFYDQNGKRISRAFLGVIYTGTSPDFCKSYNIPIIIEDSIKTIKKREYKSISIGKIKLSKVKNINDFHTKYFACCANIGLGAVLAKKASSGIRKFFGDFLGTFMSLISTLCTYKKSSFQIVIDNNKENIENLFNLSVGKTFYIASGIKVNNDLDKNNKNFYLLTVKNLNLFNMFNILRKIYAGKEIKKNNSVSLSYCNKIEVLKNNINPEIEFDGDPAGYLPCVIQEAEDQLDLICNLER
jgi:YegS/Rv2252/BmrU family lipid kinase